MSDTVDRIRESVRLATMHEPDGARVFLRTGDIRALLDRLDAAEAENERLHEDAERAKESNSAD